MVQKNDKTVWLGTALVIIGHYLKLSIWPFASLFLIIGLSTEANNFLFLSF